MNVGARVFWNDPDNGRCSGSGMISDMQDNPARADFIIVLAMDSGNEEEAFLCELTPIAPSSGIPS